MTTSKKTTHHKPEILTTLSPRDQKRLCEIVLAAFGPKNTPENLAEYIPKAIAAHDADVLVSRNETGDIASVMFVNTTYGAGKLRGRIDDVATHTDSLRQGHAGALLDFALQWFRDRGAKRVLLTSNKSRKAAHELYKSRNFKIHDTNQFQLDL